MSAFVWRNWGLVPVERMARTVGATSADLNALAADMGLCRDPVVLPEWQRKGYITVLRRNWHLLPYEQLLTLLDMSRERLRFALLEDDFLWIKLGQIKPKCDVLRWSAGMGEEGRSGRKRIAAILRDEGLDPRATEEPRFQFVKDLSTPDPAGVAANKDASSPFDFRLIFSYFAEYGDPLGDPEVASYPEGLLQRLASEGVNAVWLHTVLNTLAKDPKYPEFGEGSERRMASLRKLVARARKYGIRVFIYLNEPRAQPASFFAATPERAALRGVTEGTSDRYTMCTGNPETLRWMRDAVRQVFASVPGLGGIFTITMSENHTSCVSHGLNAGCPRCRNRPWGDVIAEVNCALIEGMVAGNPDAEALVWNWGWPPDQVESIVGKLPTGNCRLMAVSENGIEIMRGGVKTVENDYSISIVGPGESARKSWSLARERGIPAVAKVQAATSWELCTFPYLPVMDLVAEHAANLAKEDLHGVMLSWSLGCCPSPNLRVYRDIRAGETSPEPVLDRLAHDLYGRNAVRARQAWTAFSEGFRNLPFSLATLYLAPHQWGPVNPLYLKKTGFAATMVGLPYDAIDDWRAEYPAETYAALMDKVARGFDEGCRLMEGVAEKKELDMFRAEAMHFASCRDQTRFVLARDRNDVAEMVRLTRTELARAKDYWPIVRADSRIGYESSNHYFYVPRDVLEKVLVCRQILDRLGATAAYSAANGNVALALDAHGRLTSLRERKAGRELITAAKPFASVRVKGRWQDCSTLVREDGRLRFGFASGEAVVSVTAFDGGWTFAVEACTVPDAEELRFGNLDVACVRWKGIMSMILSDEASAVALRGYEHFVEMRQGCVSAASDGAGKLPLGWHFGLAAGPRDRMTDALKAMTLAAGVPHTRQGGAWSLEAEENRGSYLNADVGEATIDDQIDLCERGGFGYLHFRERWYSSRGHYRVNTNFFPRGFAGLRDCVKRIHDAGLRAGFHTLSSNVDVNDPWVTPRCDPDVDSIASYTLARPLRDGDDELVVNERPIDAHDVVFTYSGNGNAIRIGTEIVQYAGVRREKPYAFTGLTRGAFGTEKAPGYPAGTRADYLHQRFLAFFAKPGTALCDKVGAEIGRVHDEGGFDMVYFDGLDGVRPRSDAALVGRTLFSHLSQTDGRSTLVEDSYWLPENWWFYSRLGAWDTMFWGAKRFHDLHVAKAVEYRNAEFLQPQMGWWRIKGFDYVSSGQKPDEIEYFAAKNAGIDASMSILWPETGPALLDEHKIRMLTILGWYEHARLARAFTPEALAFMRIPRGETWLRQEAADGAWLLTPVTTAVHRVRSRDYADWSVRLDRAENARVRIEGLFSGSGHRSAAARTGLGVADLGKLTFSSAKGVTGRAAATGETDPDGGPTMRLTVENAGGRSCGAWAKWHLPHENPRLRLGGSQVVSLWVKGDGSGAILDVQFATPREYIHGEQDGIIRLDFKGWRYFELPFKERDCAEWYEHAWGEEVHPYVKYRSILHMENINEVNLFLNDVPAGGKTEIEVSDVRAVGFCETPSVDNVLTVNGTALRIPFDTLGTADFVELENGVWTHYDRDGHAVARRTTGDRIPVRVGDNLLSWRSKDPKGVRFPRAEVTLFADGKPVPALKPGARGRALDYEAAEPFVFNPSQGLLPLPLAVRPGEKAVVAFSVHGPIPSFALTVGGETRQLPGLGAGERLVCRDGASWLKVGPNREVLEKGVLTPVVVSEGRHPVEVEPRGTGPVRARFEFVKRYKEVF